MNRITVKDRLHYYFDNTISTGMAALIGWLFLVAVTFITIISLLAVLGGLDPEGRSVPEMAWHSLLHTLNTGVVSRAQGSWGFKFLMLVTTLGGIFVVSTLIGLVTTGLKTKLEELRRGRSFVAEEGHTVILGWSPQIFTIISELVVANASRSRSCIAILAEKDKVKMEDEIRAKVGDTGRTRVVCRTGSTIDLDDLEIVNPHAARSIIIPSPESKEPDAHVINTILALTNSRRRRPDRHHIVAAIRDPHNLEAARLVGSDELQLVWAGDLVARIAAQTCRESGLSVAYSELLGFSGDEIYFQAEPGLAGKTFGEALLDYEDSALIGISSKDGRVQLAPPMQTRIESGDKVIAIAADDNSIRLSGLPAGAVDDSAIREPSSPEAALERVLILGWNHHAHIIIEELDAYVSPGSEATIVADTQDAADVIASQKGHLKNLKVTFCHGNTTDRHQLNALDIPTYQHVIVLSYSDTLDAQQADSRTLVTLLHLRDIANRLDYPFSIVSEMVDVRKRELAEVARADDFIISDKLISLMLLQISENKQVAAVFADLFDPHGAELHFKPAGDYVQLGKPVNFYTAVESARRQGEVAVGYRLQAQAYDPAHSYGVRLNPRKSETVTLSERDRLILLTEN